ncbi:MAG: hypothetical protein KDC38_07885, partial [Planctomycetes bacterium]|nr:hypothetical protein [Planctomycetota bacterium]
MASLKSVPTLILTAVSLALVAGVFFYFELERVSPGPLHSVHAIDGEIAEQSCDDCHGKGSTSMADACGACHEAITRQIADGKGLHAELGAELTGTCGLCHADHHGDSVALVNETSFARAGLGSAEDYRPRHDRFPLTGVHVKPRCEECHPNAFADRVPATEKRYLDALAACASCHRDPHAGDFGTDCDSCHGTETPFETGTEFDHAVWFPLIDAHADVACAKCHRAGTEWSVLELRRAKAQGEVRATRVCASCHENPHQGGSSIRIAESRDCAKCHTVTRFEDAEFGADQHAAIGVRLAGAHLRVACEQCHRSNFVLPAAGSPEPMNQCDSCHRSPHDRAPVRLEHDTPCTRCHDVESFDHLSITTIDHGQFGFELTGSHLALECTACHDGRRTAKPESETECASCHTSPHSAS